MNSPHFFAAVICWALMLTFNSVRGQDVSLTSTREAMFAEIERQANEFAPKTKLLKSVIQVVGPSVVHIKAIKGDTESGRSARTIEEAGAGVIFEQGDAMYVLTNRHVVKYAELKNIHLYTNDGRHLNPVAQWADLSTDLAVLKLPEIDFISAKIGDSSEVEVGDYVIAIGSPFGLSHSVTYGNISALGRRDLKLGDDGVKFQDFMQTDAAINPGNSGGPLIDLRGRVIGINTAIASNSGGNDGIGFAIPMNMAVQIAKQLIETGKVSRPYLGVSLDSNFTPNIARSLGLSRIYGARVTSIVAGSPAAEANLRVGDVILELGGQTVQSDSHLVTLVSVMPVGTETDIVYFRQGKRKEGRIALRGRDVSEGTPAKPASDLTE